MSKKSIFKTEEVPFEYEGEVYIAEVQRVRITAEAINGYRKLYNGLPGMQELQARVTDLLFVQKDIEDAQEAAKAEGKTDEEIAEIVLNTAGKDAIKAMSEFETQRAAIEASAAQELYNAKLDILMPALRGWDIDDDEMKLPESAADKKVLLNECGTLGEVIVDALWEWYRPTTASSEAGEKTTSTADTTKPSSSTPVAENSAS